MFNNNIFGDRIKTLRKSQGVSQTILGNTIGVTKTQISDIENGKITTRLEKAYLIADYFNVSVDYLLGRTDNPKVNK